MGRKKSAELWRLVCWFGEYDHGYFGDDDGVYTGNDHADLKRGEIGNKFEYHLSLTRLYKGGKNRYGVGVWFSFDQSNKYNHEVFKGRFATKKEAKAAATSEILKFEYENKRVMRIWRDITKPEYRTAIFRSSDEGKRNYEWVASGFACSGAWDALTQRMFCGPPKIDSIRGKGPHESRFMTLNVTNRYWQERESGIEHCWDMCECHGSGFSGGGGRYYVSDSLLDMESLAVKCLVTSEFEEDRYRWTLFRRRNYAEMSA